MKNMTIFDPAMCCSTGVCGPSVDPELLRVAAVINKLKKKGILIDRHNLTNNPQIFVDNKEVNTLLNTEGIDVLPITIVDGVVIKTNAYPTDEEFCSFLGISSNYLSSGLKRTSK